MDFMSDALADGRRIRLFTAVDDWTRECLAIEVGRSLTGRHVVAALEQIAGERGYPTAIVADNVLNASCTSLRSNSHPGRRGDPRRLGETASTTTNQWSSAVVQGSLA
jgi:transposase InsO family protein